MATYARFEEIDADILRLLSSAKESVRICVAWINADRYRAVLQDLVDAGVKVEIIYNDDAVNARLVFPAGITSYPIRPRRSSSMMHNKFCIIDEEVVINGSFNWSRNASQSFENIIVVKHDYQLVAAFLHEFYDLISFYNNPKAIQRCSRCASFEYKLGIFGAESGLYSESTFTVWAICAANRHVRKVAEQHEQFLQAQLGFLEWEDQPDWMREPIVDKETMRLKFNQAREEMLRTEAYFEQRKMEVHALGAVVVDNENEVIKHGVAEDRFLNIYWKDMHYRKIIPSRLDEDYDEVTEMMDEAR